MSSAPPKASEIRIISNEILRQADPNPVIIIPEKESTVILPEIEIQAIYQINNDKTIVPFISNEVLTNFNLTSKRRMKKAKKKQKKSIHHVKVNSRNKKDRIKAVSNENYSYQCQICQKSLKYYSFLKRHETTHNKRFQCDICGKILISKTSIKIHMERIHKRIRNAACKKCGKQFFCKKDLKIHEKTHDDNRPKPFVCHKCTYKTHLPAMLKSHLKGHEYREKRLAAMLNPKQCEICGGFYRNSEALRLHHLHFHPKRKLVCDLCGVLQNSKGNMRQHLMAHLMKKANMAGSS